MKRISLLLFFIGCFLFSLSATNYFVATNGSDSNSGTIDKPFATLGKAQSKVMAGDTVYIRQGTYRVTEAEIMEHYTAGSILGAGCLKCQRVELDRTTGGVLKTVIRGEQTKNTDLDLLEIKESGNSTYEIFLRGGGRKGEIVFTKFIKRMRFFDTVESVLF